jgi:hypothetical protein
MSKLITLITLILSMEIFFFVYLFFILIPDILFKQEEPKIITIILVMILIIFVNLKFLKKFFFREN